ncbi:MAG: DUF3857 domain-containing protein [Planctomycetes bacterium]|nr:DUF3857 domain-containing protein [Planctomycetota bacterium]
MASRHDALRGQVRLVVALFALLLFAFAVGTGRAETPLPNDDDAAEAEGHGRPDAAFDCYGQYLRRMAAAPHDASDADATGAADRERRDARAEVYLHRLAALAAETDRPAELLVTLEELARAPFGPAFHAWRTWYAGAFLVRSGRLDEAGRALETLGFVRDWLVVGPFSNEGGRAAREAYPPERELRLDAAYEGILRPVAWRPTPARAQSGLVDLSAMLRPAQDVAAYALSFVRSKTARPVALRLACGEGASVWVNDDLALRVETRRDTLLDQDVAEVRLRAGWNKVLVKLLQTRGAWTFRLRFTELDGRPLPELECSADPARAAELAPAPSSAASGDTGAKPTGANGASGEDGAAAGTHPSRGAIDYLTALQSSARATASELADLGFLHMDLAFEDPDRHSALRAYRAAVDARPRFAPYRFALARASQVDAAMSPEREENAYREGLEATLALDPQHVGALVALSRYYLESLKNSDRARRYFARAKETAPDAAEVRAFEPVLLDARGHDAAADLARRELAPGLAGRVEFLLEAADRRLGDHRPVDALALADAALAKDFTRERAHARRVDCLLRLGRVEDAVAQESAAVRINPWSLSARVRAAHLLEALKRFPEAEAEYRQALALCPEDDGLLTLLGNALHLQEKTPEARAVWEKALAINPNNVALKRYMEFLHVEETPFETPFREDFSSFLPAAQKVGDPAAPAVYVLHARVVKMNKDGTSSEYVHQVLTITNEKGINDFDVVTLHYTPGEERLKVLNARVAHRDGSQDEARINTQGGGLPAGQSALDLPPLSVGDVVELEYRREALHRGFFGDYFGDRVVFGSTYRTLTMRYILLSPADRPVYLHRRNLETEPVTTQEEEGRTIRRTWELRDLPAVQAEAGMPDLAEVCPTVFVTTYASWKEFVDWYADLISKQSDVDEALSAKVRELTAGLSSPEDKIRKIYNFVTGQIRYIAWEFGIHGYKPYRATQILARKFGDCKDKALLINTMLREVGIRSFPVLINAEELRSGEDLSAPMVEHFNHCIACVRLDGRDLFLDGTASFHNMDSLPAMDQGASVLVIDDQGGRLEKIPTVTPEENVRTDEAVVAIQPDGSARLRARANVTGPRSSNVRYEYSVPDRRKLQLERSLGSKFAGAQVESVKFTNLFDLDQPVGYTYLAALPSFLQPRQEEFAFQPTLFPSRLSATCGKSERKHDLVLEVPWRDVSRCEFSVPEGLVVRSLPEPLDLETPFGAFKGRVAWQAAAHKVTLETSVELRTTRVRVADYAAYREFCNAVDFWESREAVLGRAEK